MTTMGSPTKRTTSRASSGRSTPAMSDVPGAIERKIELAGRGNRDHPRRPRRGSSVERRRRSARDSRTDEHDVGLAEAEIIEVAGVAAQQRTVLDAGDLHARRRPHELRPSCADQPKTLSLKLALQKWTERLMNDRVTTSTAASFLLHDHALRSRGSARRVRDRSVGRTHRRGRRRLGAGHCVAGRGSFARPRQRPSVSTPRASESRQDGSLSSRWGASSGRPRSSRRSFASPSRSASMRCSSTRWSSCTRPNRESTSSSATSARCSRA